MVCELLPLLASGGKVLTFSGCHCWRMLMVLSLCHPELLIRMFNIYNFGCCGSNHFQGFWKKNGDLFSHRSADCWGQFGRAWRTAGRLAGDVEVDSPCWGPQWVENMFCSFPPTPKPMRWKQRDVERDMVGEGAWYFRRIYSLCF